MRFILPSLKVSVTLTGYAVSNSWSLDPRVTTLVYPIYPLQEMDHKSQALICGHLF
jgi:hypothetical protein